MRKDSEYTFSILKGRMRILKNRICLQEVDACDNIWKICCALHTILIFIDGLTEEWYCELGFFDIEDANNIPFALCRLSNPSEIRHCDSSDYREASEQE